MDNLGSFVPEFFGHNDLVTQPSNSKGIVAVAKDNSRQIVGNIINNYYSEFPKTTKVNQEWFKIQEWLNPSGQALYTQTLLDRDAREKRANGTCSWLLKSEGFREWMQGSKKLEWMHSTSKSATFTAFRNELRKLTSSTSCPSWARQDDFVLGSGEENAGSMP